jgi:hypothetical protein
MGTKNDSKLLRARSLHRCKWCQTLINVGTVYYKHVVGLRRAIPLCYNCAFRAKLPNTNLPETEPCVSKSQAKPPS